jgi:hypothetical protein
MQLHLLVTSQMEPIPPGVTVLADFGELALHVDGPEPDPDGRHVAVEAPTEAIVAWLAPFDGVWVGNGQPAQQDFTVRHIRQESAR